MYVLDKADGARFIRWHGLNIYWDYLRKYSFKPKSNACVEILKEIMLSMFIL